MLSVGKPTATSWVVAVGVNAAVLGYVSYKLYRNAVVQHEKHTQLKRSAQRLWKLATQVRSSSSIVVFMSLPCQPVFGMQRQQLQALAWAQISTASDAVLW
jgi:hypothetical protein